MTLSDQVKSFQEIAKASLQSGQAASALNLLEQAIILDPDSAQTQMLLGIANSRMNLPKQAESAFERAAQLDPSSAKIAYNYAAHLSAFGRRSEALHWADRALSLDAGHVASQELAMQLERELQLPPRSLRTPMSAPHQQSTWERVGYRSVGVHTIGALGRNRGVWRTVGWLVTAVGILVCVWSGSIVLGPVFNPSGKTADVLAGLSGGVFQVSYYASILLALAYVVVDQIDRRQNLLWLLPITILSIFTLGWSAMIGYLVEQGRDVAQSS